MGSNLNEELGQNSCNIVVSVMGSGGCAAIIVISDEKVIENTW